MIIILIKKRSLHKDAAITSLWLLALFLLGYFLRAPTLAAGSAVSALSVCATALIPSLFPFIVLVGIMNSAGMPRALARLIGRPIGWLFGMSPISVYPIVLGALGGFPIGAVCTRELYEHGEISSDEAERLCSFVNNASPAYCIGGIGAALFGDTSLGVRLYFCQLAAALLLGIAQRGKGNASAALTAAPKRQPASVILTGAIAQGGTTMLKICSFAVFFAIVGDAASLIAGRFFGDAGAAVIASVCELTLAGRRCAALGGGVSEIICAAAVGWSGLSVHMQVSSILSGSGIRMNRYYICKLTCGILCAIFLYITG